MDRDPIVRLRGATKRFDDVVAVDALDLDIYQGEFLTLLGPSGCGKTTVLRLIAGFESLDDGEILMNGTSLDGTPPNKRNVNTVFQSYALFPHMTVFDNIAFGLKMKQIGSEVIREQVTEALSIVKLAGLEMRRPHQLSGGQQQRVAMARALVNKPQVLLLDEPLSALDYRLRQEMEIELKHLHRRLGITFVFVTHDQEEAISMSDRIAVMNAGRIEQIGTPTQIYEEPENMFVAKFVGEINVFEGRILDVHNGSAVVDVHGQSFKVQNRKNHLPGQGVKVLLRPEDIMVYKEEEADPAYPYLSGTIEDVIYKGKTVDLIITLDAGETVFVTQFFNEDQENVIYRHGHKVIIDWPYGWEVVL
ncbi:MAG TPA: spermidine/putrescine ABC transporter ATP-binding protein PotA [Deltaproteobacteria bacterium]|jgi:spermidine/putrescine transport system ATP-binding protein|nr:spermidine/putrescine ABC transporter ATP-binding protein PotA [Deltaproteobacteria bacterium]HOI08196.1 spermidine/putrescine ABC transporter ATP-binding protein PotA [Deltaproteobacteria bacterium]